MKRREFITLLGGAAASSSLWPLAARAQQAERMRRIGVLLGLRESDPEAQARIAAFRQELQKLGWTVGRNLRMDTRFGADDVKQIRTYAAELVSLAPDVIFINSQPVFDVMREATRTIPIVFVQVTDPVGRGLVASLARPGGNLTGLSNYESMGGKWLEMLKEIAPNVATAAVILTQESASNAASFRTIEDSAPSLGVQLITTGVRDATDIERAIDAFAQRPNGGLIILASPTINGNRDLIIALAARHRLPAVYPYRYFVTSGGLVSYGVDNRDLSRGAASYVDRILKGEKPGDLPIQQPTKLEFVLNLKTAKALGLTIPESFLLRADEVIE
jgi:putative tryptophan/tyrosine transport system substrate-binding protein